MNFHLYKVSGYEEAIMSVRMSKGKFFSMEKAQEIQDLVYVMTDKQGKLVDSKTYYRKMLELGVLLERPEGYRMSTNLHNKLTGDYTKDKAEFERLLGITFNNAMGGFDHHTLMKYIDVSFFTEGLHRGGQDDLDSHAMGFNNRITRFSTRLAEISEPKLSEWYEDKVIPFHDAHHIILAQAVQEYGRNPDEDLKALIDYISTPDTDFADGTMMPKEIQLDNGYVFKYTPFGYMLQKYADMAKNNGLYKDVQRGLIPIGQEGPALWKTDLWNLRYIYFRRSKLTKTNPELKLGIEQLADQIEKHIPVFGPYFRLEYTDSKQWEHQNKVRTITDAEYKKFMAMKGDE